MESFQDWRRLILTFYQVKIWKADFNSELFTFLFRFFPFVSFLRPLFLIYYLTKRMQIFWMLLNLWIINRYCSFRCWNQIVRMRRCGYARQYLGFCLPFNLSWSVLKFHEPPSSSRVLLLWTVFKYFSFKIRDLQFQLTNNNRTSYCMPMTTTSQPQEVLTSSDVKCSIGNQHQQQPCNHHTRNRLVSKS